MRRRDAIATAIWRATIAASVATVALLLATLSTRVPSSWGFRGASTMFAVTFGLVGIILARRRGDNPIGATFGAIGLLFAIEGLLEEYTTAGVLAYPGRLPAVRELGWILTWIWVPASTLGLIFVALVFPDGRLPSPRWRVVAWSGIAAAVVASIVTAIAPGPIQQATYLDNPLALQGLDPIASYSLLASVAFAPFGLAVLLAVVSLVVRFRRAGPDARQQIKWFVLAASIAGVAQCLYFGSSIVRAESWVVKALEVTVAISLLGLPISVGIAVLRYRLYDIDRIISRTLSYALVTLVLAGVFGGLVVGLQAALATFTQRNSLAVAGSTLVAAILFQPLLRRIQTAVDRRFDRSRYDAERTVASLAARLRDEVDLDRLGNELGAVVGTTLAPASIGIWLRGDRR